MQQIDDIFIGLGSHRHSKRLEAFAKIESLDTLELLENFIKRTFDQQDNELILIAIHKLEKTVFSTDIETTTFAIWALNHFITTADSSLSYIAKEALEKFCNERTISENFKNLCFRFATTQTPPEHRDFLFQLSTKYKFFAVVHLIVDQLQFGTNDKKIVAIRNLVKFRDSRGVFYIRLLAKNENTEIARAAIESLSTIGTILDALWLAFFLQRLPEEIYPTALSTIRKISPTLALLTFNVRYQSASHSTKIEILKECALIKTSQSLHFIMKCFLSENDPAVLHEALRSIYNIETTKKISTLISFFGKCTYEKRIHLLNIISDFHDERCRIFYTTLIGSDATSFIKGLALEKLCHYHHPATLALIFKMANESSHPLRGTALTSIFLNFKTKYKIKAFKIISSLPENDFLHFKTIKALPNFIDEVGLNEDIHEYLVRQFKAQSIDKTFMILDIFKYHHNSKVFELLVQEYKTTTNTDEKIYLVETLQEILNKSPFYITPSYPHSNILEVISGLSFQLIDYRLLIHLCRLAISDENLYRAIEEHKGLVTTRLENILQDINLSFEEKRYITVYLIKLQANLTGNTVNIIKNIYFNYYPRDLKDAFLALLIRSKNIEDFDFLNFNVYQSKNEIIRNEFYQFCGSLL